MVGALVRIVGVASALLIDPFFKALKQRQFRIADDEAGVLITVDGEEFRFWIQETRDRKRHDPTSEELKRQDEQDRWRIRFERLNRA